MVWQGCAYLLCVLVAILAPFSLRISLWAMGPQTEFNVGAVCYCVGMLLRASERYYFLCQLLPSSRKVSSYMSIQSQVRVWLMCGCGLCVGPCDMAVLVLILALLHRFEF